MAHAPIEMMLFTEDTWNRYCEKVRDGFKIKTYPHFDDFFDFPKRNEEIKKIVSDPKSVASHPFLPLVKVIIKTPRYKYQGDSGTAGDLTAKEREQFYGPEIKARPISFASHLDTYIYGFYAFSLTEKYQNYIKGKAFSECVSAYRTDLNGKCNIQFANEVFQEIKTRGNCTAIAIDIKGYFDTIDHQLLKERWCRIIGQNKLPEDQYQIFRSLTKYSYANKISILKHFNIKLSDVGKKKSQLLDLIPNSYAGKTFLQKFNKLRYDNLIVVNEEHELMQNDFKRYFGIPQGSSLSAVLSNIYLIDFDEFMKNHCEQLGFFYRRYCDDILLIAENDKASELYALVQAQITKHFLNIQEKKTEIIEFRKGQFGKVKSYDEAKLRVAKNEGQERRALKNLQYLGFEFNGTSSFVRPSSLSRYFRKMKARIVKTIQMAYSKKSKSNMIFKQQIFHRYTHLGKRNFLTYAYNASRKYYINSKGDKKDGLNSPAIRRQLVNHFKILQFEIEKTSKQRAHTKMRKVAKR